MVGKGGDGVAQWPFLVPVLSRLPISKACHQRFNFATGIELVAEKPHHRTNEASLFQADQRARTDVPKKAADLPALHEQ